MEQVMGEGRFPTFFTGLEDPWNFAAAKTTKARLKAAGFGEVNTWLHEEPTQFDSMDELARFLKTVVLGHHLEKLPESQRGNTLPLWWPHGSYREESSSWTTSA
jgi:hypothetical protein